jgi:hypothetical protein
MLLCLRSASDIPLSEGCPFLGFARNSGRGGTVTMIIAPLVLLYPERSRVHPERRRGVGPYTGVLVSASLDEQFVSKPRFAPRAEPRGGTVHRCSRLGFARRTVFERSRVYPERSRVYPERSRGVFYISSMRPVVRRYFSASR